MCGEGERFASGDQPVLTCLCSQVLLCHFPPHALYLGSRDSPSQGRQDNRALSAAGSDVTGKSLESEVTRLRAEAL